MEDKRANRALQGTDEFFRSIFQNAQIGIAIYNIQSGEHFSNHAMHEMLGYSQEELRRTEQWDQIVHAEPLIDVSLVADAVLYMANLPLEANVQFMTVMATKMPYIGRG